MQFSGGIVDSPDSTILTTGRNVWPAFGDSAALSGGSCAIVLKSLDVVTAQKRSPATLIRKSENACFILRSISSDITPGRSSHAVILQGGVVECTAYPDAKSIAETGWFVASLRQS